jgi:hypothetical protein
VKNYFGTVERFPHEFFIGDTALNQIDIAADLFEVFTMTRREIVNDPDARTAVAERRCNVRTNKARTACYDNCSR